MGEDDFTLDADSRPRHLNAALLARLEKVYSTGHRAIRRWWKAGAPVMSPAAMPEWWVKNMTHSLPDKIAKAAEEARSQMPEGSAPGGDPSPEKPSAVTSEKSLSISETEMGEGEAVSRQRMLCNTLWAKLKAAYDSGDGIDMHTKRYEKAMELLRKLEVSDRADRKQRGDLIPRGLVKGEIYTATELLKHMRESMVRKVRELCPGISDEIFQPIAAAIIEVRGQEDRVFQNLHSLRTSDDVAHALAA